MERNAKRKMVGGGEAAVARQQGNDGRGKLVLEGARGKGID